MKQLRFFAPILFLFACKSSPRTYSSWESYGGGGESLHYSSLTEIDTANVSGLQVAWTFHTGDADTAKSSQMQCNPIIIDSVMYVTSPTLKLMALHAGTGRKLWEFNPDSNYRNKAGYQFNLNNSRGVTYWSDGKDDKRIFFVASSFLHCVDAVTGKLISSFGNGGIIDLHDHLGRPITDLYVTATTPGIIYNDLFIIGSRVDEGAAAAPGHIRAFDVRSGQLRWIFHTIPQPGEYGYDTWEDPEAYKHIGGANSWGGFSLDQKNGILFAPTGSASFDFYGGKRRGQNLFANCLLALNAATGKRIWHFQFIHHDTWDWDTPCPPVLATINKDGKDVEAVIQATKHGMVWVFERKTGNPVYPINEVPVDTATTLTGEKLWPTQPMSTAIKPFVRQTITLDDINPYLADSSIAKLKKNMAGYKYGKMFTPQSKTTTIQLPGLDGGNDWGGPSFDPETGMLYVNANEMGWLMTMRDNAPAPPKKENYAQAGLRLYSRHCLQCHGADKKGTGNYPTLIGVQTRYTDSTALELLNTGRRMMPSFKHITDEERKAIVGYLLGSKDAEKKEFVRPPQATDSFFNLPYGITGYNKFLGDKGMPAISPPWGTLTAVDMNKGEHVWKTPLGEYPQYKARGIPATGVENYGSSVVTAGGLLFIAAARDGKLRAFNKRTGKLLWEYDLPAPGYATPSIYEYNGKQYLVIACGGGKMGTKSGDAYLAFALPEKK
jgi:quinoprotein glucose dehydrogenase